MANNGNREHHPIEENGMHSGHRDRRANVRGIGAFVIGFILLGVASILMLNGLFRSFETHDKTAVAAGSNTHTRPLPPEPRLQDKAVQDLERMQTAEDQLLNNYGWIDRQKGVVRIPIDLAIGLLAQRGLPPHAAQTTVNNRGDAGVQAGGTAIGTPAEEGHTK